MRARYWHTLEDGRIECEVCPRRCHLREGQAGYCFVRQNHGGVLDLVTYGRTSGLAIDPIEKKPIYHVLPGSSVLSFGTAGCNLGCRFCQNWHISTAKRLDVLSADAPPEAIAQMAVTHGCSDVAYTYNEPTIYPEYAIDTAQAVHAAGLLNIAVTAGYINPEPRDDFFAVMDAANVDLKSINPTFYRQLTGGRLEVVQETLKYLAHETNVWLEVTTLLIPGENDSTAELHQLADWVLGELGPDIPLHLSAFHPANRMLDTAPTPASTVLRARQIALDAGLRYVYSGNISDDNGTITYCPSCNEPLIVRRGFREAVNKLADGQCPCCQTPIPGHWRS